MFQAQRLLYTVYLAELAKGAKALGYTLTQGPHGTPELAHISRAQIAHFSTRAHQVEAALAVQGLDRTQASAAQKQAATLATRAAKQTYDRDTLQRTWQARGQSLGLAFTLPGPADASRSARQGQEPTQQAAERAAAHQSVQFALAHLGEREAAFRRDEVLITALRTAQGDAGYRAIAAALTRSETQGEVWASRDGICLTTAPALALERRLLTLEAQGRGQVPALMDQASVTRQLATRQLTAGQATAVALASTTTHRVIGINGLAGTGKTTALQTVRELAEAQGYTVVGLAPSHSAVRALRDAGLPTQTVHSWLADRDAGQALHARTVLVVDEAGLTGNTHLVATLGRAERVGARVILVGDVHQYQAVEAGRGFTQLQEHGMATAQMREMLRQRTPALATAARLAVEQPALALQQLDVREIPDAQARRQQMAQEYVALSAAERAATLLLTGTNAGRQALNAAVRQALGLAGRGQVVETFQRQDLTQAEQRQLRRYEAGEVMRFERTYRSLQVVPGDVYQVTAVHPDHLTLTNATGRSLTMHPQCLSAQGYSVGTLAPREITPGEWVRFTATDRRQGYTNGDRAVVEAIGTERLYLRTAEGRHLTLALTQPLAVEYAYALTGHSAQGLGAQRILLERGVQHKADEADDPGAALMPGSGASGLPGGSSNCTSTW